MQLLCVFQSQKYGFHILTILLSMFEREHAELRPNPAEQIWHFQEMRLSKNTAHNWLTDVFKIISWDSKKLIVSLTHNIQLNCIGPSLFKPLGTKFSFSQLVVV